MTKKQLAELAGITVKRLEQIKREILKSGVDYDIRANEQNSTEMIFTESGIDRVLSRNKLHYITKKPSN